MANQPFAAERKKAVAADRRVIKKEANMKK
jgi:hypothetical protein